MIERLMSALAIGSVALMGVGCSSEDRNAATPAQPSTDARGDSVTVSGCLTTGQDGRAVLTAAPDPGVSVADRAASGARDTYTYVLVGGENLQSHVGKRVEVTGTVAGKTDEVEHKTRGETRAAPTGKPDEAVRTSSEERVDVEIRGADMSAKPVGALVEAGLQARLGRPWAGLKTRADWLGRRTGRCSCELDDRRVCHRLPQISV
jgi:hypothetical protein